MWWSGHWSFSLAIFRKILEFFTITAIGLSGTDYGWRRKTCRLSFVWILPGEMVRCRLCDAVWKFHFIRQAYGKVIKVQWHLKHFLSRRIFIRSSILCVLPLSHYQYGRWLYVKPKNQLEFSWCGGLLFWTIVSRLSRYWCYCHCCWWLSFYCRLQPFNISIIILRLFLFNPRRYMVVLNLYFTKKSGVILKSFASGVSP